MVRLRGTIVAAAILLGIFAAGCGDDDDNPTNPGGGGTPADVTINISGQNGSNSYTPSNATVSAGQTVSWKNNDSMIHTATANNGAFNTGNIAPGATSAPIQMSNPGTFGYHCELHPSMIDTLIVQ